MIIFNTIELRERATFTCEKGLIEPVFTPDGSKWMLDDSLLSDVIKHTDLTYADLDIRELTAAELTATEYE